jgi:hypothetical protein
VLEPPVLMSVSVSSRPVVPVLVSVELTGLVVPESLVEPSSVVPLVVGPVPFVARPGPVVTLVSLVNAPVLPPTSLAEVSIPVGSAVEQAVRAVRLTTVSKEWRMVNLLRRQ